MVVLGIESTAHTASVGVIGEGAEVLGLTSDMYPPPSGGIHPREAANHHVDLLPGLVEAALDQSKVDPGRARGRRLRAGTGPGPVPAGGRDGGPDALAHVGRAARGGEPLCRARRDRPGPERARRRAPPLCERGEHAGHRVRRGPIPGPWGDPRHRDRQLPRQAVDRPGRDVPRRPGDRGRRPRPAPSCSRCPTPSTAWTSPFPGLLTAALEFARRGADRADIAYSVEATTYAMLTEITERALAHLGRRDVVLGGGVACNERLRGMVRAMVEARGGTSFAPPRRLCVDNGAMIAWTGLLAFRAGSRTEIERSAVRPRQRTDLVDIPWRSSSAR